MKKVLLTTSALTLLAGAAAAGVTVSGSARFNIRTNASVAVVAAPAALATLLPSFKAAHGPVAAVVGGKTLIENRARVNFKLSGQTDGGLTFGAGTRLQTTGGTGGGVQGAHVFISNGTATLTIGNVDGAIGSVAGMYAVGGCGWSASPAYGNYCANVLDVFQSPMQGSSSGGAGSNVARVNVALGALKIAVSATSDPVTGVSTHKELAASYSFGAFGIAAGTDTGATAAVVTPQVATFTGGNYLTLSYSAGGIDAALTTVRYTGGTHLNAAGKTSGYILKAAMPLGNGKVGVFVANDAGGARSGVNYKYSLGGGATVIAAVTQSTLALSGQNAGTTASLGMTFGF